MFYLRKSIERGLGDHGWLKSRHTFSFADYHDPKHIGFGPLRVINEDRIEGSSGFATHGHRDMEIISYVISGALAHEDSMGNTTIIRPGEVQRMSAGTGVQHSEYNQLASEETHFLQIWILPAHKGLAPSYGQRSFAAELHRNELVLVVSQSGRDNSVTLNQDVDMYAANAQVAGQSQHKTSRDRHLWLQVISGEVEIEIEIEDDQAKLRAGDGVGINQVESVSLRWSKGSEFILFDMTSVD